MFCFVWFNDEQASLLGEALTGKGILSQLNLETGIPIYEAEPLLLFFILFNLLGAIGALGDRGRFVDEATGLDKAVIAPGKGFRSALGLGEGGNFTLSFIENKSYVYYILQAKFDMMIMQLCLPKNLNFRSNFDTQKDR